MNALLIVDVQNDFCEGGSLAVPGSLDIIEPINKLIEFARDNDWTIVASLDWHPAKTTHFDSWPSHCVKDTYGAQLHSDLDIDSDVKLVLKGTRNNEDGYSAFDGLTSEGYTLDEYLKSQSVKKLYVVGLATDYCVKASAIDASTQGYKTVLVENACKAVNLNSRDEEEAINAMGGKGVELKKTEDIINMA